MKRLLTAGIFGTILGIVGTGTTNASIVSSGFLDEKLTEYALSTSLDLKANQTDLTALSNKIGDLPDGLTVENLYNGWTDSNGEYVNGLSIMGYGSFTTYDPLDDTHNPGRKAESGGYLGVLARLFSDDGYYQADNSVLAPFWYLTKQSMRVGEIPQGKTAAGMIDEINTKIGTLPSGDFPGFPGHMFLSTLNQPYTYPTSLAELINAIYGNSETGVRGLLEGIFLGFPVYTDSEAGAGLLPNYNLAKNANDLANANATKIGTLPSGSFLAFPYSENFFSSINPQHKYPTSLAELITAIYGNSETGAPGLLPPIIHGFQVDTDGNGAFDSYVGTLPNFELAKNANDLANANATKIGTVPDGKNLAGMISETDAKIGTLPAGYDSVGAALTAIKGIAEDAKAAALAAIPDPKQEGSSGKFVLTVDIVGDNATYHWEKIDREGETTTTTTTE